MRFERTSTLIPNKETGGNRLYINRFGRQVNRRTQDETLATSCFDDKFLLLLPNKATLGPAVRVGCAALTHAPVLPAARQGGHDCRGGMVPVAYGCLFRTS